MYRIKPTCNHDIKPRHIKKFDAFIKGFKDPNANSTDYAKWTKNPISVDYYELIQDNLRWWKWSYRGNERSLLKNTVYYLEFSNTQY